MLAKNRWISRGRLAGLLASKLLFFLDLPEEGAVKNVL
jgi:hypothetical protein